MKTALLLLLLTQATLAKPFAIHIVDDQTGRGIPLVELRTTSLVKFYTDSAGWAAIDDPAMLNRRVYFDIRSHGYECKPDGFGSRGSTLTLTDGGEAELKLKRINIAERLYRITGEGIYRDSVMLGKPTPITQPLIDAFVTGQDSAQCAVYQNKIWFFFGDTNDQSYKIGHFSTSGATSELNDLDPSVGINLHYFTGKKGFARPMIPHKDHELHWLDGLTVVKDDTGRDRMIAVVTRLEKLNKINGVHLAVYNDDTNLFDPLKELDPKSRLRLRGHPFRHDVDGIHYIYFGEPFPNMRVQDNWKSITDPASYEAYVKSDTAWSWKRNTQPSETKDSEKQGADSPYWLRDASTQKTVRAQSGAVTWNDYRKKWVMITVESFGSTSMLGEVWYAEADAPEGPWHNAVKITTHDKYSFYNPLQHPFYSQQAGKIIYFEGTYSATFSRDENEGTPRYDYNQMMYRLDLSDPRLHPN